MTDRKTPADERRLSRLERARNLAQLPPKRLLEALLDAEDARALTRSLPADHLYYAITDVGLADATDVVQLASPTQFRTFVDLGGWQKDRVDPKRVLAWLAAARSDDRDELLAKVHALDTEVLEVLLRSCAELHDLEADPDVNPPGPTMETPEGKYLLEFKVEGLELITLRRLVDDLIAENPFEAVRFLEAVRWEVPSEMEETAYRFRAGRLEDLGFPPLDVAMSIYAYVDPDQVAPRPAQLKPQGLVPTERVDYLQVAIAGLDAVERETVEQELRYLANQVLVAEAADPGDPDALRNMTELCHDYLSLGLEHLTGGRPENGAEIIRDSTLKKIFQVGFSLTLKLKHLAQRLVEHPLARVGDQTLFFEHEAKVISALLRKRPMRAVRVEGAEPVAFRQRREVAEAARTVERAGRQALVLGALLGGTPQTAKEAMSRFAQPLEAIGVQRLFGALVANAVLDGRIIAAPVPAPRLTELWERLFDEQGALRPSAVERAITVLEVPVQPDARPEVQPMVQTLLNRVHAELGTAWVQGGRIERPMAELLFPVGD